VAGEGAVVCEKCPRGTYSASLAAFECTSCAEGSYNAAEGSVGCAACAGGEFLVDETKVCEVCPDGQFSNPGKSGGGGIRLSTCATSPT
jgi:hypothetical protein